VPELSRAGTLTGPTACVGALGPHPTQAQAVVATGLPVRG